MCFYFGKPEQSNGISINSHLYSFLCEYRKILFSSLLWLSVLLKNILFCTPGSPAVLDGVERLTAEEMDERRQQNMAYEYLCHLEEAKRYEAFIPTGIAVFRSHGPCTWWFWWYFKAQILFFTGCSTEWWRRIRFVTLKHCTVASSGLTLLLRVCMCGYLYVYICTCTVRSTSVAHVSFCPSRVNPATDSLT